MSNERLPLEGLRVVDAATMMAAPWAATYLGDFGAEVIKIEYPKTGDQARRFGAVKDGVGVFWKTLARNKKCITLNLGKEEGKELLLKLLKDTDIFIENFRPGTLERWGFGWDVLHENNPRLVVLRCSGFGQTGPYSHRGGFGSIAEGMSGFAAANGYPDGPPTLPPTALADGVTSIFAALSIMIALYERDVLGSDEGQLIDINLYEPLMRLMEASVLEYSTLGNVPQRMGNRLPSAAPRNVYATADDQWVSLSASTQPIAERVFHAIGRPELIDDPRFRDNPSRVEHVEELDEIIGGWMRRHTREEIIRILSDAGAVVGPIYTIDQLFSDPQVKYRHSIIEIEDPELGTIAMPNVVAKFSRTPGRVRGTGPRKGQHNEEIFGERLGLSKERLSELKEQGII